MGRTHVTVDGNEAAARIAHRLSEVIAIYPITPASPMGELSDAWSNAGQPNIFGSVPDVIEMQSEAGAAGAVHGALQAGAMTTTFTASQGLLLMIPNMYKIAGELTPTVFHVAARSLATHALSIFGDHSDVMAVRQTGWGMLASASVQEAHDLAAVAHAVTYRSRIPILHFFDGFRTSHEVNRIDLIEDEVLRQLVGPDSIEAHRRRALSPDSPVLRGSAQNPDVFFQAREAINGFYLQMPGIVQAAMDELAEHTGRRYRLFDYVGAADAEDVIILMGSGAGAAQEAVEHQVAVGERVGLVKVRLYRPFDVSALIASLPASVKRIAVLDRTKEPGAVGEPLYQDVLAALAEVWTTAHPDQAMPSVIGGRYGLSSKEFTPAMVLGVFDELRRGDSRRHFTVGIVDDVTGLSIDFEPDRWRESDQVTRAVFYGLGSDGTVGANKNSVKIVGENTDLHAQGYFVYDSKKSGSVTVSHLRFSPKPITSSYLISQANFVACHQFQFVDRMDVLAVAEPGARFLLNSPYGPDEVWDQLPTRMQQQIVDRGIELYVIDAYRIANEVGLGNRINTVMQTCFFALSGFLPVDDAILRIKEAIQKSYGKRGATILERNNAAVDQSLAGLHQVVVGPVRGGADEKPAGGSDHEPDFVQRVTRIILAGHGDRLPVSALPVDGTFPTATAQYEKRSIAQQIPIWDPEVCIECGLCAFVCPHAAIRSKAFSPAELAEAPEQFLSIPRKGEHAERTLVTIQVAPDDCTGCGVCVDVCPARSREVARHKAINMEPKLEHLERERERFDFFRRIPEVAPDETDVHTVKGSQLLQPLFEFSGACGGCGETPYLKLVTQLFGDRMVVANATGCSSIYGGNLPTTPWSVNSEGRGPAWSNSLFEDNAEFGLGIRLGIDQQRMIAEQLLPRLAGEIGDELVGQLLNSEQRSTAGLTRQRELVQQLKQRLEPLTSIEARLMKPLADSLVDRSVWIVGGDGWAYDIGFGGLDHVLASGRNVNILVLDTEVYSNTGGQASKATPRGAVAKFAAGGKAVGKKDLGMIAVDYGNVYVAQVAMGAQPQQTLNAFLEAESYPGVSLIIAYSHCIAHGIDMTCGMSHQKDAVKSGYWPLFRFDPRNAGEQAHPFHLDCRAPTLPFKKFALEEGRYAMLARSNPEQARRLFDLAQKDINERWHFYEQMAGVERSVPASEEEPSHA